MKILISYEDRVRPDSTAVYFKKAFETLGHEVTHVYPEQVMTVHGGHDFYVKIDDGLGKNGWNKDLHPSQYYSIDNHIEQDWRHELAVEGDFDTVSVTQKEHLKMDWTGVKHLYWNAPACDPDFHYVGPREKVYDVCFIGHFHANLNQRLDMVDHLFHLYPNFYYGARTFKEMTEKIAQSRIGFNYPTNFDANMRVYETMCSGTPLVTLKIPEMEHNGFIDGVHYFGYETKEELKSVCDMILSDPLLQETVGKTAHDFVVSKHTYVHRAQRMLDEMNKYKEVAKEEAVSCHRH